jgi:hypothetical protein
MYWTPYEESDYVYDGQGRLTRRNYGYPVADWKYDGATGRLTKELGL